MEKGEIWNLWKCTMTSWRGLQIKAYLKARAPNAQSPSRADSEKPRWAYTKLGLSPFFPPAAVEGVKTKNEWSEVNWREDRALDDGPCINLFLNPTRIVFFLLIIHGDLSKTWHKSRAFVSDFQRFSSVICSCTSDNLFFFKMKTN